MTAIIIMMIMTIIPEPKMPFEIVLLNFEGGRGVPKVFSRKDPFRVQNAADICMLGVENISEVDDDHIDEHVVTFFRLSSLVSIFSNFFTSS